MSEATDFLKLLGSFGPTVRGDELKGWTPDPEGGVSSCYLSADDCREVARQFTEAARKLDANEKGAGE